MRTPAGARNRDPRGKPLSPVVRRLLDEHKLDAAAISGTGDEGRIKRGDVLAYIDKQRNQAFAGGADRAIIPFSKIRKRTAEHMVRSKTTSPHVLQAVEVDFSRVEAARRQHGAAWRQREGFSLTYLPFVAAAVCRAIQAFPNVNANVENDALVIHKRVHLGIAVDLGPDGLIVPVVHEAHAMKLPALARAIRAASEKARANKLTADDVTGGTYTLTNNGSFGTLITAPIINQPQVAVLSMDGVKKRPVVIEAPEGDSIAIRPVGILAQSFDHRAIDGAYSAQFLNRLRELLETTDWVAAAL
jgi:2-oxoglutarate dehydrogenase E2 component (dihydrolipoamide succinyltransferase)